MKRIVWGMVLLLFMQQSIFAQKGKSEALTMMGSSGGLLLYTTYFAIGSVGDAFEKDVYKSDYVKSVMDEQVNSLKIVREDYQKTLDAGFFTDNSDQVFVKRIINELRDLSDYANTLTDYTENNTTANADIFQDQRKKCWKEIADMLGIKE